MRLCFPKTSFWESYRPKSLKTRQNSRCQCFKTQHYFVGCYRIHQCCTSQLWGGRGRRLCEFQSWVSQSYIDPEWKGGGGRTYSDRVPVKSLAHCHWPSRVPPFPSQLWTGCLTCMGTLWSLGRQNWMGRYVGCHRNAPTWKLICLWLGLGSALKKAEDPCRGT